MLQIAPLMSLESTHFFSVVSISLYRQPLALVKSGSPKCVIFVKYCYLSVIEVISLSYEESHTTFEIQVLRNPHV